MHTRLPSKFLLAAVAAAGLACLGRPASPAPPAPDAGPRLAVLLVFDQLRGDYLQRWQELFGEGGFRRLQKEGAWFTNCHYPYGGTFTGPGHASLATGCTPAVHGIVDNDWYDRDAGEIVNCVATDRYKAVPPAPPQDKQKPSVKKVRPDAASPERLLAPTVADALKEATGGKGRVVALSLKDRSAVLPGGRRPDACYWFDAAGGRLVTSTYYRDQPHDWVAAFNRERFADRWFGRDWGRMRSDLDYAKYSGPDDVVGEGKGIGQGRTFPHPTTGGLGAPGKDYYQAVYNSPFGNELLLELAKQAVVAENLGADDAPDLLSVSFSSNDLVGHTWGPDSQEVLDMTLRTDRLVKELLDHLDERVGKGRYTVVLTADHGVCPLPEVARARGKDAGRIVPGLLRKQADEFLHATFGKGGAPARWVEEIADHMIYLDQRVLRDAKLKSSEVEKVLAGWLVKQPGIQAVYTRTELMRGPADGDALGLRIRRSFHPARSGDVIAVPRPHYFITSYLTGTTHGTPHAYDTHVAFLAYGRGVRPGVRGDEVTPLAAAAILAQALDVKPSDKAEAPLPAGLGPRD
jgi:hypothetical protein